MKKVLPIALILLFASFAQADWNLIKSGCLVYNSERELGSGTVVKEDKDTYTVLTAAHVVLKKQFNFMTQKEYYVPTDKIFLLFSFTGEDSNFVAATLIRGKLDDNGNDFAYLKFKKKDLKYDKPVVIPIAESLGLNLDDKVFILGSPAGMPTSLYNTHIKSFSDNLFWVNNHALPGQSGSSVIKDGKVIGIVLWQSGGCSSYSRFK